MNRIKTMSILVLSFICLQANGQKLSTEQVQNNIDKVFELNKKMETKIASWRDWDIRLSPDSVVFLKNDYTNVILDLINNTEKEATPQQNVLLQYYKLAVSKNNLSLLRLNGYMQEAKEFSKNYEEVLAYKPKLDGMAPNN